MQKTESELMQFDPNHQKYQWIPIDTISVQHPGKEPTFEYLFAAFSKDAEMILTDDVLQQYKQYNVGKDRPDIFKPGCKLTADEATFLNTEYLNKVNQDFQVKK